MARHWILVADATTAMLFTTVTGPAQARLLESYFNEDGRKREGELHEGGSGTVFVGSGRHVTTTEHTAKDHVAEGFARKLAHVLKEGRIQDRYDAVTVSAPAHFLGLIKNALDEPTTRMLDHAYSKDLVHEPPKNILLHLESLMAS